jgi:hypothetical protein
MRRLLAIICASVLVGTLFAATEAPRSSDAADAGLFDPGYIIDDAVFYNGGAMNGEQVQAFLTSKVSSCTSGYTCLMAYSQATPSMAADAYCAPYAGSPSDRAADIIAKVGAACNISQEALLVLLEKEQSLVSMRNPSPGRIASATGFSCPDTAPCDPSYAGFFYQMYYAARQFQKYAANPTQWNYQAGRVNNILFHPNGACGSSPVYIQNKATAGLYIYTPYQPNAAALANLYGTGDGCSSYGNRNFWRIFTDWFGSPTVASSLVRTASDTSVYLISSGVKYPVASLAILAALAPLGRVAFVSQGYLDRLTTGHNVGRSLRGPDGSIYFYDAGIKLPFPSCTLAADYGASCDPSGYVQLTDAQINKFVTGPVLGPVLGTAEGSRYWIKNGTKAEILDNQSQVAAGLPLGMNVLTENAVAHLPLAAPVVRDGAYALQRGSSSYVLLAGGLRYGIADGSAPGLGVPARTAGSLSAASLAKITAAPIPFSGLIATGTPGTATVLTADGRFDLTAGGLSPTAAPVTVPQALIDTYPVKGVIAEASFIMSPTNATVWVVMPTDIRPVTSWDALLALTSDGNPVIVTVSQSLIDLLAKGPDALIAGTLVRSPENETVYFINGVSERIPLSRFEYPVEAGWNRLIFASEKRIQGYPLSTSEMTFGIACGTSHYIAAAGSVHLVDATTEPLYPFTYVPMDRFTCASMKVGAPATSFIRTPDGSIYQLVAGQKRPIASMTRLGELGATSWLNVANLFAEKIPTGPLA